MTKPSEPFHNPFANLQGHREALPPGAAPAKAPQARASLAPRRAVVRYERKGHGGKEMTRVEHLGLSAAELEQWLTQAKRALGCGGAVQDGSLLLQGDHRSRLPAWLEQRGVGKLTVS